MADRRVGPYYAPEHGRRENLDAIQRLQSRVVRILDPDIEHILNVAERVPGAFIMPRIWSLDDRDGSQMRAMMDDPEGTGVRHANEWESTIQRWMAEAQQRGRTLPVDRLVVTSVNEPNQAVDGSNQDEYREMERRIARKETAFLNQLTFYGRRGAALSLGVGHPAILNAKREPDWSRYLSIQPALDAGGHWVNLHEYWYWDGPLNGAGWWAGRHRHCPLRAPIVIGETGIDLGVDMDRWKKTESHRPRGWLGNVDPATYADQIRTYLSMLDRRVVGICIYSLDHRAKEWGSFDWTAAQDQIVAMAASAPDPGPIVVQPAEPQKPPTTPQTGTVQGFMPIAGKPGPSDPEKGVSVESSDMHPLGQWLIGQLSAILRIDPALAQAFFNVESGGVARVPKPVIRFEPHVFKGRIDPGKMPAFDQAFQIRKSPEWDGSGHVFKDPADGQWKPFHGNQDLEYRAFVQAWKIDRAAAFESTSAGAGQIMGFNHAKVGYPSAEVMFQAYGDPQTGQLAQIGGFFAFVANTPGLLDAVRNKDFRQMAMLYNGAPSYEPLIRAAYQKLGGRV